MLVSGDSHVVEPPVVFQDYLNGDWHGHAPYLAPDHMGGERYVLPGTTRSIGLGLAASAGALSEDLLETGTAFADIRLGAWQPGPRLDDQDRDGVGAEVLYPTVGLFLLRHINRDFSAACMAAYNTWLAEFCAVAPSRLVGCGATAVTTPDSAVRDLGSIRRRGLKGVLLPLEPAEGSYADEQYDVLWATACDLALPVAFHALPPDRRAPAAGPGAPLILPMWDAQEVLTGLVFGGVLHRWPDLRVVFAEFDAGWVPHLVQRMDHYFHRHHRWLKLDGRIRHPPSEYIARAVHFTFQDDPAALRLAPSSQTNLLWASDFPHAESTWPTSRASASVGCDLLPPQLYKEFYSAGTRSLYAI
ncbi:amidohydrolase family protein [Streptomyces sp. NPDC096080]|uniref:amidohydrolase family protein n=1 Tax=Streptomyces sp. NPDC096080 TaxID=3156693 RepID=UPI0033176223